MYVYNYALIYIYIHTHIHIYLYTYIHTRYSPYTRNTLRPYYYLGTLTSRDQDRHISVCRRAAGSQLLLEAFCIYAYIHIHRYAAAPTYVLTCTLA